MAKVVFVLSLLGIFILIILTHTTQELRVGIIKSVQPTEKITTIQLENETRKLILFDTPFFNLKTGTLIKFQGKESIYKNQKQIIVDKLFIQKAN